MGGLKRRLPRLLNGEWDGRGAGARRALRSHCSQRELV